MRAAIEKVRGELGREYDLVIGGKRSRTSEKIRSLNPARPSEVVGVHQKAGIEHVEPAMQAALAAFESWKNVAGRGTRGAAVPHSRNHPQTQARVQCLDGPGGRQELGRGRSRHLRSDRLLEFYARLALHMAEAEPAVQLPGERDALRYIALGVGAVIPPWNFPLAIMCGMTVASMVCGNTVVLKPSSDSPTIAAKFFEALEEAGLPPGVVNFCPGSGATFGNGLVEHPKTRFIAFTGSRDVGLDINVRAAQHRPGQLWIKRTILEMGGKDSIVVAADADLDAAVEGVAASAFGFQGQKCSACSRAIVDASLYDRFLEKLQARVAKIRIGDPAENAPAGPVVNAGALKSISELHRDRREGRPRRSPAEASALSGHDDGYFLEPTVIADIAPTARLAQEEIFGPVLAVIRARDFDDALAIANNTEYGLTGSIYSASPQQIERARNEFHVGNLYINRKCTGAIVGAHPFGGFNMSGTDSKAGGADYLYLFSQAKSIAEKLSRRYFLGG